MDESMLRDLEAYESKLDSILGKPSQSVFHGTHDDELETTAVATGTSYRRARGIEVANSVSDKPKQPSIEDKINAAQIMTGLHPTVPIPVEQSDVDAVKEKAMLCKLRMFDKWVINDYLRGVQDDTKRAWLLRVYPEWFQNQKEVIEEIHVNKEKYQKILLYGPRSKEDLWYMFSIQEEYPFLADSTVLAGGMTNSGATPNDGEIKHADTKFREGIWPRFRRAWNVIGEISQSREAGYALQKRGIPTNTEKPGFFGPDAVNRVPWTSMNSGGSLLMGPTRQEDLSSSKWFREKSTSSEDRMPSNQPVPAKKETAPKKMEVDVPPLIAKTTTPKAKLETAPIAEKAAPAKQ